MPEPKISLDLFSYAISRIKNWKSPGIDCLHGYWLKHLTSIHCRLLDYFNSLLSDAGASVAPWLLTGRTTLIMKNLRLGPQPSNYRPITCFPPCGSCFHLC